MGQVGTGWTGTVWSPYFVVQVGLGQEVLQIRWDWMGKGGLIGFPYQTTVSKIGLPYPR